MTSLVIVKNFKSIQILRLVAALAIVFFHIPTIGFGTFGVDIFFVISGFVMLLSTEIKTKNFFLKRLIRILPIYYIFTVGVFIISWKFPFLVNNTTADINHLIKSFFFIPFDKNGIGHYPILFIGWTLNYEMYFYSLFAVSLIISKRYRSLLSTFFLSFSYILCKDQTYLPLMVYSNSIVFEFVLGMMIYELIIVVRYRYIVYMSLMIFIAMFWGSISINERFFYYGIPSAFAVGFFIYFFEGKNMPKFLLVLGSASYAMYITHPFVIQIFSKVLNWFDSNIIFQMSASVLSFLLINLLALGIYYFIELPSIKFLRKLFLVN